MKTNIVLYLIIIVLFIIYSFSIYKLGESNQTEKDRKHYEVLLQQSKEESNLLADAVEVLLDQLDSLRNIPAKIIYKEKIREVEINSVLAIDSNLAVSEYRKSLKDLDVRPDTGLNLTKREVGYGALLFNELKSKREQLFNSAGIQDKQTEIIDKLREQQASLYEQITLLKAQSDLDESFWHNRFAPFLGIGLSYNGKIIEPALQLGFGIRIN